ncbi:hypothetical protein GCM10011410_13960 [Hoyosella rhizosphaerae]|uniref:Pirin family protein n=1 Tax=Hoyosella rhizosphaerae TaxID=1755582 RepID=A0A916U8Q8_9ACTN|nr:pirin family protein [Hoyosella rhizosphaerae]GGC62748.1 hypothetical protein GCM10011410_13960 [Hoyosella rhizosphaerae]
MARAIAVFGSGDRFHTSTSWLDSWHSFSFGPHYDPTNTHHGALLVNNEERITPLAGYDSHPHQHSEILTWVLEGTLVHQDSNGNNGVVYPGRVQRLSAGSGVLHSERNDPWPSDGEAPEQPVRLIQMTVTPDETGTAPDYAHADVDDQLDAGGWVALASGQPKHVDDAGVRIRNTGATLFAARLTANTGSTSAQLLCPEGPFVHLQVVRGSVDMEDVGALSVGDTVRLTNTGGHAITATSDAEVLVWEMHRGLWS